MCLCERNEIKTIVECYYQQILILNQLNNECIFFINKMNRFHTYDRVITCFHAYILLGLPGTFLVGLPGTFLIGSTGTFQVGLTGTYLVGLTRNCSRANWDISGRTNW